MIRASWPIPSPIRACRWLWRRRSWPERCPRRPTPRPRADATARLSSWPLRRRHYPTLRCPRRRRRLCWRQIPVRFLRRARVMHPCWLRALHRSPLLPAATRLRANRLSIWRKRPAARARELRRRRQFHPECRSLPCCRGWTCRHHRTASPPRRSRRLMPQRHQFRLSSFRPRPFWPSFIRPSPTRPRRLRLLRRARRCLHRSWYQCRW